MKWRRRLVGLAMGVASCPAIAQTAPPPANPPNPAPYSLPWLLRPAVPASVVRLDETMAFYQDAASGTSGSTYVTSLIATYKVSPSWVPIFREIWVSNNAPSAGHGGAPCRPLLLAPAVPRSRGPDAALADQRGAGAQRSRRPRAVHVRGPRFHVKVAGKHWLRPGLSYSRALDDPMAKKGYDTVQLDVPFAF